MTLEDLLHLVPNLIKKVDSLETELKQTKLTMGKAIVKLVKKVKKLEDILKRRHVVLTDSEDEDPEDQGRIIKDINDNPLVSKGDFITPTKPSGEAQEEEISPTTLEAAKTLLKVASQRSRLVDKEVNTGFEKVNTSGLGVSTGSGPVSSTRGQREGKAPMIVEETQAPKRTKEQIQQEKASLTEAIRLQTLEEEETAKQAQHYTKEDWDAIRAKLEANAELTKNVLGKELLEEDFAKKMLYKGTVVKIWRRVQTEISKENKRKLIDKDVSVTRRKRLERSIYQIIRANGADTVYMSFGAMLKDFTREDLIELYRLVIQKYGTNRPEDAYDRVLWSDLRTMFDPPLNEDEAILCQKMLAKLMLWKMKASEEAHNEDIQRNLKFTSEDQVRGGLLGIIVNRLKSGSYRVKSGRHS
ncbi:hypothetical protein Tco_1058296 [Tanacetum coccineum]|uniref:Uncharacterized protein n=1 Tax=Tanacetum coccineum TaxID=301880 RepID=A0ABQ5H950_9ASTR